MKNIRKYILSLVAVLAVALGFGLGTPIASANVYLSATTCTHSSTKFICFDVSAQQITIKNGTSVTTYPAGSTSLLQPTKGWLAYDIYECNAGGASNDTSFNTTGSYGLPPTAVFTADGAAPPAIGSIYVTQSLHDTISWLANSQTGYNCIIVP